MALPLERSETTVIASLLLAKQSPLVRNLSTITALAPTCPTIKIEGYLNPNLPEGRFTSKETLTLA